MGYTLFHNLPPYIHHPSNYREINKSVTNQDIGYCTGGVAPRYPPTGDSVPRYPPGLSALFAYFRTGGYAPRVPPGLRHIF